jgi:5-formyltetrahydrofolate cyclo-ligase
MEKESALKELQKLVSQCAGSVLYMPAKSEVDYSNPSFPLEIPKVNLFIPNYKDSDPFEWADNCLTKFKNSKVCMLIPGTRFDIYGTRYGKGAGWYDRFLSKIPPAWLRIGIIDSAKFSNSKLIRQEWDELVNWVLVRNNTLWKVYKA